MASFLTSKVQSTNQKTIIIAGSFSTDSNGDISAQGSRNKQCTATRTGEGAYRVTLSEKVPVVYFATAIIEKATAVDADIQIASITNQQLNLITRQNSDGAAADIASATVHFLMLVDDLKDG